MSEHLIQPWLNTGDQQAAEALYQAHHKRIYRLAYGLLGNIDAAEQVMQETMVHALTNTRLFNAQQTSFTAWLHTFAVGRCRDHQRRDDRADALPGGAAATQENRHQIWPALDQLSPQLREALVLRYWSGHSYQEMTQILRCPLLTTQSRVRMAYEQLTKLLDLAGKPAVRGKTVDE